MYHYQGRLFYPRSPCGERPYQREVDQKSRSFSIHALLAESDNPVCIVVTIVEFFYPRSPCGERRFSRPLRATKNFFYPRSPCGERHQDKFLVSPAKKFSIHALLAESDQYPQISIKLVVIFYPRSPCGERLSRQVSCFARQKFSIHALLAESDSSKIISSSFIAYFLSTLSLRRATLLLCPFFMPSNFLSTLSLRRATFRGSFLLNLLFIFYPRSPCGERQGTDEQAFELKFFLSTLSLRRATE